MDRRGNRLLLEERDEQQSVSAVPGLDS